MEPLIRRELGGNTLGNILNLGCGNGLIQEELYGQGYHNILNIDISGVVIEQMRRASLRNGFPHLHYEVMDATALRYPDGHFDMVLDKSTIDALLCSENPKMQTALMLEQVERVLRQDGVYLAISYAEPRYRMEHLTRPHLSFGISVEELRHTDNMGEEVVHYIYICRKKPKPQRDPHWRTQFYEALKQEEEAEEAEEGEEGEKGEE